MPGRFVCGRLKTQRPRVRRRTGYRLRYRANRALAGIGALRIGLTG